MVCPMLNSSVLVLNRGYFPVHVTNARRAFCLLYSGLARAINGQYETFDYPSWSALAVAAGDPAIGVVGRAVRIPRVVVLVAYDRVPRRNVRFSRRNIFVRDRNTCQYCGKPFPSSELNLDHVVPRSQGGKTNWENIVCSCIPCNKRKGGNRPEETGMRLVSAPRTPRWSPEFAFSLRTPIHREWVPFLNVVDFTYWNLELQD
jgi:5-methylcytosine-specific restriction endonuclease McrA